jgi:hypothetical protein
VSGAGLFNTTLRIASRVLLLGQGKSRDRVISRRALITVGGPGGGRSDTDELTAAASRSIHFIYNDSAERVTTIFGSAWPSLTASFSSSSGM